MYDSKRIRTKDFNRRVFNRLNGWEQDTYLESIKNSRIYVFVKYCDKERRSFFETKVNKSLYEKMKLPEEPFYSAI